MNAARLSLIRFVTARQFELRGLREVVFGIFICVAIPLLIWRRESGAQTGWLIHLALYIVVQEFALQFVDRPLYYLGALAVLVAAPAVDDPSRLASFLPAYFACGLTLALAGLLNHLLLAGAVARLRPQGVPESTV
jgi:hypothetical protein